MSTYKIVRSYFRQRSPQVMAEGLSLDLAQAWCRDPETSSSTCKEPKNVKHTEEYGPWFDGYTEE